jgi:hypothetical protein
MKTQTLIKAVIAMTVLGSIRAGAQIYTLDQSQMANPFTGKIAGNLSLAQTFTPSVSGTFAHLDLYLLRNAWFETQPLVITITDTSLVVPNNVLGSTTLSTISSDNRTWYSIDFTGQNIQMNAHSLYAFILSCPGSSYGISDGGTFEGYSGGMCLQNSTGGWQPNQPTTDLTFQTWMVPVPEPAAGLVLVLGIALGCISRK